MGMEERSNRGDGLYQLRMILECSEWERISYNKASLFQGVIMQNLDSKDGERLHAQGLKPYSQYLQYEKEQNIWYVNALSLEAYEMILVPLLSEKFHSFVLAHNDIEINIMEKQISHIYKQKLIDEFYEKDAERCFKIDFLSPTAFKREGHYHFFPEISNIYYSLMKRYDSVSETEHMLNEDTFEQLIENTRLISYKLKSVRFSMEGVQIPSFMGNIVIRINGPQTMVNFAKMLFQFANYSGIGIKTAIGMGAVKIEELTRREK